MPVTVKLYYSPGSCSMGPHIALEEAGAAYEPVPVVLAKGGNHTPEYRAIHARGLVPVLQTDGQSLTEAVAIMLHIARRWPDAGLLPPAGSLAEARALELLVWLTNTLHVAYACLWRPARFTKDAAAGEVIQGEAKERIAAFNDEIETRFEDGRPFAAGDAYSLADAFLIVFFRWANLIGLDTAGRYPRWRAWATRMEVRPAVARVLNQEGVSLWGR